MGACGSRGPPPGAPSDMSPTGISEYRIEDLQEKGGEERRFLLMESPRICALFIAKVNAIIALQMVLTSLVSLPITFMVDRDTLSHQVWLYCASLFGMVMLVAATSLLLRDSVRSCPWNVGFFFALTLSMGIVTGFACAMYLMPAVAFAVASVAAICGALASYAWFTRTDFMGLGPYIFAMSCGLALLGVLLIFVDAGIGQKIAGGFSAIAFCLYVIHDSQLMADGKHGSEFTVGEYFFAAICIYLDMASPCQRLIGMMGSRQTI